MRPVVGSISSATIGQQIAATLNFPQATYVKSQTDFFLKGDSIRQSSVNQNPTTAQAVKNFFADDAYQASRIEAQPEQIGLTSLAQNTSTSLTTTPQTTVAQKSLRMTLSQDRQFKIKQVSKSKRSTIACMGGSTQQRFFNNQSAQHRKLSAIKPSVGQKIGQALGSGNASSVASGSTIQRKPYESLEEFKSAVVQVEERETPFMSQLESFIQQQKQIEDKRLQDEIGGDESPTVAPQTAQTTTANTQQRDSATKTFKEFKQTYQSSNFSSGTKPKANARLFAQNVIAHDTSEGIVPILSAQAVTLNSVQSSKQIPMASRDQRSTYKLVAASSHNSLQSSQSKLTLSVAAIPLVCESQIPQITALTPTPIATQQAPAKAPTRLPQALQTATQSQTVPQQSNAVASTNQATSIDDQQSIKTLLTLCRTVQSRVEDIHVIRQSVDIKQKKVRHVSHELFDDLRSREVSRLAKENGMFQTLAALKQSDSVMTRRQLIKHCKKIFKVFWNVIEAEEEQQDINQMVKFAPMYMATELNLLQVYSDKGEKIHVFKRCHAIQAKLLEAVFREKDFELNFGVAMSVQKARQTFLNEVSRAALLHREHLEGTNANAVASIKRAVKSMGEAQYQRRLRLATVNAKTAKMYESLILANAEVMDRRGKYASKYALKMQAKSQKQTYYSASRRQGSLYERGRLNSVKNSTSPTRTNNPLTSRNISSASRAINLRGPRAALMNRAETFDDRKLQKRTIASAAPTQAPSTEDHKSNTGVSAVTQASHKISNQKPGAVAQRPRKVVHLRKYKWQHLYSREACIGFFRSSRLRAKLHWRLLRCPYYERMSRVLKADIDRCLDELIYNNYSMKKGSEHHLTLIVESRALRLQKLARSIYRTRSRAAKTIQEKLKHLLYIKRNTTPKLRDGPETPIRPHQATRERDESHSSSLHDDQATPDLTKAERWSQSRLTALSPCIGSDLRLIDADIPRRNPVVTNHRHVLSTLNPRTHSVQKMVEDNPLTKSKGNTRMQTIDKRVEGQVQRYRRQGQQLHCSDYPHSSLSPSRDLPAQQGSQVQAVKQDLWGYYGSRHLKAISRIQRAFRKRLNEAHYAESKLHLRFEMRYQKLYSDDAQDLLKGSLFTKLKARHLPSAGLDCRKLELANGETKHRNGLKAFAVEQMAKASGPIGLEGSSHEQQAQEEGSFTKESWREFWTGKIVEDVLQRLDQRKHEQARECTDLRKQLFVRQMLKPIRQ